jgi:hypothetical protein
VLGVNSNLYLRTKGLECFLTLKMFSWWTQNLMW